MGRVRSANVTVSAGGAKMASKKKQDAKDKMQAARGDKTGKKNTAVYAAKKGAKKQLVVLKKNQVVFKGAKGQNEIVKLLSVKKKIKGGNVAKIANAKLTKKQGKAKNIPKKKNLDKKVTDKSPKEKKAVVADKKKKATLEMKKSKDRNAKAADVAAVKDKRKKATLAKGDNVRKEKRVALLKEKRAAKAIASAKTKISPEAKAAELDRAMSMYWHKGGKGPDPKLADLDNELDSYWEAKKKTKATDKEEAVAEEPAAPAAGVVDTAPAGVEEETVVQE